MKKYRFVILVFLVFPQLIFGGQLSDFVQESFLNNTNLLEAELQASSQQKYKQALEKNLYYPNAGGQVFGSQTWQHQPNSTSGNAFGYSFRVSQKLFAYEEEVEIEQQAIRSQVSRLGIEQQKLNSFKQIFAIFLGLSSNRNKIESEQASLQLFEQSLEKLVLRNRSGTSLNQEVKLGENLVLNAKLNIFKAEQDKKSLVLELEQLVGRKVQEEELLYLNTDIARPKIVSGEFDEVELVNNLQLKTSLKNQAIIEKELESLIASAFYPEVKLNLQHFNNEASLNEQDSRYTSLELRVDFSLFSAAIGSKKQQIQFEIEKSKIASRGIEENLELEHTKLHDKLASLNFQLEALEKIIDSQTLLLARNTTLLEFGKITYQTWLQSEKDLREYKLEKVDLLTEYYQAYFGLLALKNTIQEPWGVFDGYFLRGY